MLPSSDKLSAMKNYEDHPDSSTDITEIYMIQIRYMKEVCLSEKNLYSDEEGKTI